MTTSHFSCDSAVFECVYLFLGEILTCLTAVTPAARNCSLKGKTFFPEVMEYRRWWYAQTHWPLKIYAACVEDIQSFAECHVVGIRFFQGTSIEAHKLAVTLFQGSLRELVNVRLTPGTVTLIGRCSHLEYLYCAVCEVPSLRALEKLSNLQFFAVVSFSDAAVGALDNFLHVLPNLIGANFGNIPRPHDAPLLMRSLLHMACRSMVSINSICIDNCVVGDPADNPLNALTRLMEWMCSSLQPQIPGHARALMDMDETLDESFVGDFIQLGLQCTSDRCIETFLSLMGGMSEFRNTHLYCDPRFGELLLQWATRVPNLHESAPRMLLIILNTLSMSFFSPLLIREVLLKMCLDSMRIDETVARDVGCIIGTLCNHSAENRAVFGVPGIRNILVRCASYGGYYGDCTENVAEAMAAITQDHPANQILFAIKEVHTALITLLYAHRVAYLEAGWPIPRHVTRAYRNILQQKASMTDDVRAIFEDDEVLRTFQGSP